MQDVEAPNLCLQQLVADVTSRARTSRANRAHC